MTTSTIIDNYLQKIQDNKFAVLRQEGCAGTPLKNMHARYPRTQTTQPHIQYSPEAHINIQWILKIAFRPTADFNGNTGLQFKIKKACKLHLQEICIFKGCKCKSLKYMP